MTLPPSSLLRLDPRAEAALRAALGDPDWRVRRTAAVALIHHGGDGARDDAFALLADAALEPNGAHADSAAHTLRTLVPLPGAIVDRFWARTLAPVRWPNQEVCAYLWLTWGRDDQAERFEALRADHGWAVDHFTSKRDRAASARSRTARDVEAAAPDFAAIARDLRDPERRGEAFEALMVLEYSDVDRVALLADAARCVDPLMELLIDGDPSTRSRALRGLSHWVLVRGDVRGAVLAALDDASSEVRWWAARGLWYCEEGREPLMRATRGPDLNVCVSAAHALTTLAPSPSIELDFWRRALADPTPGIEEYALKGIARLATEEAVVVPILAGLTARSDVRAHAVEGLLRLARNGSALALDALLQLRRAYRVGSDELDGVLLALKHPDAPTPQELVARLDRSSTTSSLQQIGAPTIGPLVDALRGRDGARAARALADLGRDGRHALLDALAGGLTRVRRHAMRAMLGLARRPMWQREGALADLEEAGARGLRDADLSVRVAAVRLLTSLAGDASDPDVARHRAAALAVLRERIAALNSGDRRAAASTAATLGPAAAPLTSALLSKLAPAAARNAPDDHVPAIRSRLSRRVAHALGAIGPAAHEAAPALIELLSDPCPLVRRNATSALGRIALS